MVHPRPRHLVFGGLALALALPAAAVEPVPDTAGWRGFFVLGLGHTDLESNLVAGNRLMDIGPSVNASINQRPRSDSTLHPAITGEVNYTFENGWQAFLGTSLEDAVTLDAVTQLGVRRNLADAGTFQAGLLVSGITTQSWEDPYAENIARQETDRESTGVRLQWDRVMGSPYEVTLSYRDISFDNERSGQGVTSVACNAVCQGLLRRDGDQVTIDVAYLHRIGGAPNHFLKPSVGYRIDNRDGDAVAGDSYRLQLSYVYAQPAYTVTGNLIYGQSRRDARNPLFGVRTDEDRLAVNATLFYRLPASSGRWQAVGSVLWGNEDSDVRFHDSRLFMVTVGAMYRFGTP
jgi:hypothetical protein